jgi:glucosamine--fructose-6-phosphate aminotransferase (isomerizing)
MWARIPVEVQCSSEFRYGDPIIDEETLCVAITQSGETADTLAGVREARDRGAKVIAITNVVGSRVTRESDGCIYTHAGPEIGVAATKTFTAQIAALTVLALKLAQAKGMMSSERVASLYQELCTIPDVVEAILHDLSDLSGAAQAFVDAKSSLFLGRGFGVAVAMEGALKLKEISYIHAEAYPAGELKHGPLALVTSEMPVVTVAPNDALLEKLKSNLQEVRARGGELFVFADADSRIEAGPGVHVIRMPEHYGALSPILHVVPLQLLAYHTACARGTDVDKPRNLAKSVTVE